MPLLNLRDVAEHTSLRPGLLYRSAQPQGLSAADEALIARLRLIADLRGEAERAVHDWPAELTTVARLGLDETGSPASLPHDLRLGELYVMLLDHRTAWFAQVIAAIADGLPALVHCAAGKDRTGIVVALILDLLGIGHDDIVRDYALTGEHLAAVTAGLVLPDDVPAQLLQAPPAAMRTLLAALAERGGAEKLLTAHGLGAEHVARLRAALVTS
ncbi:tyrosine-protein phosphatase [Nonomuraea sp. NN258]|uniref:tyrosine-protein phosphatase n=1 Tax=Nonomuraea antri TaxID=2730852 RepID=UPI00156960C4|nr:tyrosine-protein phosphatase [Nonomuraea antri]NRQ31872.1 tyrosine-protein phosphatase [Nonomuraea antri]